MPLSLDENLLYAPDSGMTYRRCASISAPYGSFCRCDHCALGTSPYPCKTLRGNARNSFVVDSCRKNQNAPPFCVAKKVPR
jgi:hypothetical protein